MNEQDYQSRHDALEIRIKSTWKQVDAEQDQQMRAMLWKRADDLQAELIELETTTGSCDPPRELQWWEAQYASKLNDLSGNRRGRPIPTPEELRYFEGKIESLGGDVAKTEPPAPWIAYHDQLIKEWFDGEKALIDDLYPAKPARVEDPVFGPLARGVVTAACMAVPITATFVLLVWSAKLFFGF